MGPAAGAVAGGLTRKGKEKQADGHERLRVLLPTGVKGPWKVMRGEKIKDMGKSCESSAKGRWSWGYWTRGGQPSEVLVW